MIYVYLWKYVDKNSIGHLSLQLSDGTYISFWPKEQLRKPWKPVASEGRSYEDDVEAEERNPDETLELPDGIVKQEKIRKWWKDYVDSNEYLLVGNNCCEVVKKAMVKGGIYDASWMAGLSGTSGMVGYVRGSTPAQVMKWLKECKKIYENDELCVVM